MIFDFCPTLKMLSQYIRERVRVSAGIDYAWRALSFRGAFLFVLRRRIDLTKRESRNSISPVYVYPLMTGAVPRDRWNAIGRRINPVSRFTAAGRALVSVVNYWSTPTDQPNNRRTDGAHRRRPRNHSAPHCTSYEFRRLATLRHVASRRLIRSFMLLTVIGYLL